MNPELAKYATVFFFGAVKFLFAPIFGVSLGVSFLPMFLLTVSGMMTSVTIFTYAGLPIREAMLKRFWKKRKVFTKQNRRIVRIWRKYGVVGVAFFTPSFFSPIIGTLIAVSFGEHKGRILFYMFLSALFWGVVFCSIFIYLGTHFSHNLIHK